MNKWRLIWRWTLILGWFAMSMFALFSSEDADWRKMYFTTCLLLVGYNLEKLVDGR